MWLAQHASGAVAVPVAVEVAVEVAEAIAKGWQVNDS